MLLWGWINQLLVGLGQPPITKTISLAAHRASAGSANFSGERCRSRGDPPMTRFIAAELAKDHWFNVSAAHRDLGYKPRVSMAEGTQALIASLR